MQVVSLSGGNGGKEAQVLIEKVFMPYLQEFLAARGEDAGVFEARGALALSTDSFVIDPLIFEGGDIGKLCVCGSANDVAMGGAHPKYLSVGFILEEGLEVELLQQILSSMQEQLRLGGLKLLSLDTKVVPKGCADKIFINTTAVGSVLYPNLSAKNLREGQVIIVSGAIGTHGALLFSKRAEIQLDTPLASDCQQLFPLLEPVFKSGCKIHALRDATRGGLASVLHEWAQSSKVGIEVDEDKIPILEGVRGVCEILGLEPYVLANEGVCVLSVEACDASKICALLQEGGAKEACIIGRVISQKGVFLKTPWGSKRPLDILEGELLPRIC
ncbi:Hydrogenase expression/formation protein HypE [Helicobacter sp. NHP19-012]|uniref:Hydrogenase expression/formation protein HypE n=1 Tax=Helicobacter gastrofelis TaxID=2849642 RepID=A0ABM7SD81_9HELI|nr:MULTISPECIES: hydrogenase expression/formation protein HypE [unclassified Helicobacter]BCZ18684.1 Hydrogenase expression/formation protein HypE [Helicobacter sp. NHP19-012]GMB95951.1 Hydrogenase expression/formation protein HypE [Helicobacter sp. NHP22-001]